MKKQLLTLNIALLTLVGVGCSCSNTQIKVICPTGAPALAFYNHATDENFETNSNAKQIVSEFTSSSTHDLVILPTDTGIKAITKQNAPFKIAATITFGNFYLAATGNDSNEALDVGDKIVLFGQNTIPDKIFHYIYGDDYNDNISYVTAVSDAAACLKNGYILVEKEQVQVDYVLIAQPALFAAKQDASAKTHEYADKYVYENIQEKFKEKSGGKSIMQASIFVNNNADKNSVNKYLTQLEKDINEGINNPDLVKQGLDQLDSDKSQVKFGVNSNVAKATIKDNNSIGIGYKSAKENKDNIDTYLKSLGDEETSEQIYF